MAKTHGKLGLLLILVLLLVTLCTCDINKDKQECANQLVGLATCLPYVGGQAKVPTQDCCTGLKQVLKDSKKCLCILVKDRDDPSLGLKINATLALDLPRTCHANGESVSECPALLHLSPNSPEAKVFTDFAKAAAPTSSTPSSSGKSTGGGGGGGASAKETSDSAKGKRWLVVQTFYGALLWCFVLHLVF